MAIQDEIQSENKPGSSSILEQGAQKADEAIKHTAQSYLDKTSMKFNVDSVERYATEKPLVAAGIAAAAGFAIGGGLGTRAGLALLAIFGRRAISETASNFASAWWSQKPQGEGEGHSKLMEGVTY